MNFAFLAFIIVIAFKFTIHKYLCVVGRQFCLPVNIGLLERTNNLDWFQTTKVINCMINSKLSDLFLRLLVSSEVYYRSMTIGQLVRLLHVCDYWSAVFLHICDYWSALKFITSLRLLVSA